jgi:hypothetical protein
MKNKTGIIIGFLTGMIGFLLLFKIIFLDRSTPEDELAPGMVVLISILSGVLLAFAGRSVQNYLGNKN